MNLEEDLIRKGFKTLSNLPSQVTIPVPRIFATNAAIGKSMYDWHNNVLPKFLGATLVGALSTKNLQAGVINGVGTSALDVVLNVPRVSDVQASRDEILKTGKVTIDVPVISTVQALYKMQPNELVQATVDFVGKHVPSPVGKASNYVNTEMDKHVYYIGSASTKDTAQKQEFTTQEKGVSKAQNGDESLPLFST